MLWVALYFGWIGESICEWKEGWKKGWMNEWINEWMFRVSTEVSGGYEECTKDGILISDIFCLPKNYRKDVPPHSKQILF